MAGPERVNVEIAWPQDGGYRVMRIELPTGATAGEALAACGLDAGRGTLGVFGRPVQADTPLRDGERLELYLPLRTDPKTARRRRAAAAEKNRPRR
jgi:putative ubiquitin-RnfH superfamily antitoxin RatB of RatAB toxin-antitoxin module